MFFPWLSLAIKTGRLAVESQNVIARRMMRIAGGGKAAQSEIQTMFSEKAAALTEAQFAMARGLLLNTDQTLTARRVLTIYQKRVNANNRRLSRDS